MSRKDDLERHIRETYDAIHQYEEIIQTSDRPEEKTRAQRRIKAQWELIRDYYAQYQTLCRRIGASEAADISEIVASIEDAPEAYLSGAPIRRQSEDSAPSSSAAVPIIERPGILPQLYQRLQTMLLGSNSFRSDSALSPLFVDSRISQWRDMLPSRDSPAERVQAVIEKLWGRYNDRGENALVLLLYVLRDQTPPGDADHKQLAFLADELAATFQSPADQS